MLSVSRATKMDFVSLEEVAKVMFWEFTGRSLSGDTQRVEGWIETTAEKKVIKKHIHMGSWIEEGSCVDKWGYFASWTYHNCPMPQ